MVVIVRNGNSIVQINCGTACIKRNVLQRRMVPYKSVTKKIDKTATVKSKVRKWHKVDAASEKGLENIHSYLNSSYTTFR